MRAEPITSLLVEDFPTRECVWGPALRTGSINMLHAETGAGKSWLSTALLFAVSKGHRFLGWDTRKTKGVQFDGELGKYTYKERAMKLDPLGELKGEDVKVLTLEHCEGGVMWNMADANDQLKYEQAIGGARFVVIDNLNTCSFPTHKNDDEFERWWRIQPWLLRLRQKGLCILLVHHSNRAGDPAGTLQKERIMHTVMSLKQRPAETQNGIMLELAFEKTRDFSGADAQPKSIEMIDFEGGVSWIVHDTQTQRLTYIRKMRAQKLSTRDIADQLGISPLELCSIEDGSENNKQKKGAQR